MIPWSAVLILLRPRTLLLVLSPIGFAFAMSGQDQPLLFAMATLSAVCIQVATNIFNDYLDSVKGVDSSQRAGPVRATLSGMVSPQQARRAAFSFLILSLAFGLYVVYKGGWPVIGVGVLSLALAYLYSGGPRPLSHTPYSEFFVFLFFGVIPVMTLVMIVEPSLWREALLGGAQLGLLSCVVLGINNLRDLHLDQKVGKKTLAVVLGFEKARSGIYATYAAVLGLSLVWLLLDKVFVTLLAVMGMIALRSILQGLRKAPERDVVSVQDCKEIWTPLLYQAITFVALFAFQLSLGFLFHVRY